MERLFSFPFRLHAIECFLSFILKLHPAWYNNFDCVSEGIGGKMSAILEVHHLVKNTGKRRL